MSLNLQAGIFEDVEKIDKGIDGFIVGKALTKEQIAIMNKNGLKSEAKSVRKFLAKENLLIAVDSKNFRVLAINKRFNQIEKSRLKSMIGNLIHDFDEPTTLAHDKMLYWIYDANGEKLSEDDLKRWKGSVKKEHSTNLADFVKSEMKEEPKKEIDFNPYVTVKLSSDQPIMTKQEKELPANIYLMISSDKLIKSVTDLK